ncbi:hypothetical protein MTO96_045703 [Rhipicephalus appendiculatus]
MRLLHCVLVHLFGTVVEAVLPRQQTPEICNKRPDPGKCEPTYPAWYYDSNNGFCKLFLYSGCGGNSNRFLTELAKRHSVSAASFQGQCDVKSPFRLPLVLQPQNTTMPEVPAWVSVQEMRTLFQHALKCMSRCSIIHAVETCRLIHKKMEEMKKHSGRRPE